MSQTFFQELEIPEPDSNLEVGSGTHAEQTAALLTSLENELHAHRPDLVVVYGDVNSTLAAALVAAKLGIPVSHVEAGLRSFDRSMPEEINRVVTDHLAALLFTTSNDATRNLTDEGLDPLSIHFVGNPMIDTLLNQLDRVSDESVKWRLGLVDTDYVVATVHRPSNVDDITEASRVLESLASASQLLPVVLPLHPRGREKFEALGLLDIKDLIVTEPMRYREFLALLKDSSVVVTDSGGIQEETTALGIPCLTMRPNTERPVTLTSGTNQLVSWDGLQEALAFALARPAPIRPSLPPLWDGSAGERIAAVMASWF